MSARILVAMLAVLCLSVTCVLAQNYLPMDPDDPNSDHWYVNADDSDETVHRFSGEPYMGYATHHIVGWYQGAIAYYTIWLISHDADGNTWSHGQSVDGGESFEMFTPAWLFVDANVHVGLAWSWESDDGTSSADMVCNSEEDILGDDLEYHHAFAVQRTLHWPDYTFEATAWFADGFGIMRFWWGGDLYVYDLIVATQPTTLSGVKDLFR